MPADEFRRHGHRIVDRIADYLDRIEEYPVLSQIEPGWLKSELPESAPEMGEDFGDALADLDRLILPAVTHWNHPNFHGLFSTSGSSVGIFGEMIAAAFDMKAMLWRTSPASRELEDVTLDWMRQMLALPVAFALGLQLWFGLALLSVIPRLLGRGRGRRPASPVAGLPGGFVFLPLSSLAGALAGLATGMLSRTQPFWWVALLWWGVGTLHGLLAWRLARTGFLLPPESL
jgi:hypothetical protein